MEQVAEALTEQQAVVAYPTDTGYAFEELVNAVGDPTVLNLVELRFEFLPISTVRKGVVVAFED